MISYDHLGQIISFPVLAKAFMLKSDEIMLDIPEETMLMVLHRIYARFYHVPLIQVSSASLLRLCLRAQNFDQASLCHYPHHLHPFRIA